MKRIIRLTESDLTRIVRRVIKEQEKDERGDAVLNKEMPEVVVTAQRSTPQSHRRRQGSDPGFEEFFADPMNRDIANRLQAQLENDKFAKGPEFLRKTNIGKGTRLMYIYLNDVKMTPSQFIIQTQGDCEENYCHTIKSYDYDNRALGSTNITIKTTTGNCQRG